MIYCVLVSVATLAFHAANTIAVPALANERHVQRDVVTSSIAALGTGTPTVLVDETFTTVIPDSTKPDTSMTAIFDIYLGHPLKVADAQKTLPFALRKLEGKPVNDQLPFMEDWKAKAPRSSVIFKVKKVQFQDARYGMACDVVEMLQDYFSGQLGSQRGYRTDFIIKDEADHHLMYGRVRQKHWWEGTALAPPGQLQPLRNVTSDDDDDNDGWGQYVPVIPAITAANVSDYSSGSDRDGDFFGTNGWYYPLSDEAGFGSVSGPGSGPEAPAQQSSAGLIVPVQSGVPPVHADGHALGNAATEGLQAY